MKMLRIKQVVRPEGVVSRSKLYADAAAGLIQLHKCGGMTLVREDQLARYLAGTPLAHNAAPRRTFANAT